MTTTSIAQARISSRNATGFTLIELVITIAVVAILAAIAYASYQDQIVKSRRAAGAACLQERAQFMERFYTTNLTYVGAPNPPPPCDAEVSPHYAISFAADPTAKAYILLAVPQGGQETRDTKCATLTLNAQGARGIDGGTASDVSECW